VRKYLSYFPSHCDEAPPVIPCTDPVDRREESLLDLVPDNAAARLRHVQGHPRSSTTATVFDLKPRFARNLITCLARINGRSVGIVANNPMHLGGVLDIDAADKGAHFIQICDAFNIPLVFFQDTPGFMVGSKVEHAGIIRHGAKMLHAMSAATVPKLTVVVRKAYGAGYFVMCGRAYEPDLIVAWPGAEISVMGAEGMVGIAAKKLFRGEEPPPEVKQQMVEMIQGYIDIYKVAGWGLVDDVIDPRDTRRMLAWGLELSRSTRSSSAPTASAAIIPV
jgi:acetyl-CoA carboxylase carboxyltransferase component